MTFFNDHILWKKLQKKDEKVLKKLFFLYHEKLVLRAYHYVNDQQVAEELVQDLFLTLWEKAPSIELRGKIENYLMVSIKNRSFNFLKSRYAKLQLTDFEDKHFDAVSQTHEYDIDQLQKKIDWSINELPEKCREIFILSRRHEMSYQEIADKLQISKKTVETQMGIALKKLRQLIK